MTEKSEATAGRTEKVKVKIKKYANRRLYNTATSSYVTLDHLSQMVKDDIDFIVNDAKTGEDITHQVLTQIIVEEEGKGRNLLPTSFLRQLISFYGDSLQAFVPRYLEMSMESLARNQEQVRRTFGNLFPFPSIEEMSKQNMQMMEQAMRMFAGGLRMPETPRTDETEERPAAPPPAPAAGEDIKLLADKLNDLQKQIEALTRDRDK
ncbi:polyhydroxyalkanoate synthesis repressor PhaR [Tistrella mobilis]|uniref:Polyhydroxyalkanoate synthesis repressor PhaR n=1 Tax=Tistrella mobilis (strain KA081020-065) TaxID=1110502 RepID=I3TGV7_TISMK|nr:polyhydroxyalkanoate synthesis repressor PhaR [Tistrella mobilis]AFK51995.1 polyhydroxyalkanoate synthesis repressor PhaR [Tistrella mobilis KA081020-065]MAM73454.1 polyhydroxyalkanoate synthesis repressor PhaR [Tistrella sp.]